MENIKIQSTVYPEQQPSFNEWAKELRVGIAYNTSKLTDKAQDMMNLWDRERQVKYLKQLTLA
jgi:hypothetical protein